MSDNFFFNSDYFTIINITIKVLWSVNYILFYYKKNYIKVFFSNKKKELFQNCVIDSSGQQKIITGKKFEKLTV